MAIGTITTVPGAECSIGSKEMVVCDVVLTSGANYQAGGSTVTPAAVGLSKRIEQVWSVGASRATSGGLTARTVAVDYTAISGSPGAVKLQVFTTASAEAATGSDQSTQSMRLAFIGV